MHDAIANLMMTIDLDHPRTHANLTLFPARRAAGAGPPYLSLRQALAAGTLEITEVSEAGSVPHVTVRNKGAQAVLILDGEELVGAKQNRALNTTVMVLPGAELIIPVSCVERGRWRLQTRRFSDSDHVMPAKMRSGKALRVSASLRARRVYDGDQFKVWEDVDAMLADAGARSPTSAMADAFTSFRAREEAYLQALAPLPGQCGFLALVNGRPAGLDVVSRPEAYAHLHEKLLRSYAFDAAMAAGPRSSVGEHPERRDRVTDSAMAFLADARAAEEEIFPSLGAGQDHRLRGARTEGSALVVDDVALHVEVFPRREQRNFRDWTSALRPWWRRYRDVV